MGLCVRLWTPVGACLETPWPGWWLPQYPHGKVLKHLWKVALEPGAEGQLPGVQAQALLLVPEACTRASVEAGRPMLLCPEHCLVCSAPCSPGCGLGPAVRGCCQLLTEGAWHIW